MDLNPSRNVYLTSQFILSVLFLTGSETSVVPTCVPCHTDLHPGRNVYLTSWFDLSVLFLTGVRRLLSLHVSGIPLTWTSTPVGTSTSTAGSCCLSCF